MDRDEQLINALRTILGEEIQLDCLFSTDDEIFLVEDENNRSIIKSVPNKESFNIIEVEINGITNCRATHPDGSYVKGLLAVNRIRKSVHLLAVDDCVFSSVDPKRCDCLLFDDQWLCFVEFKLKAKKGRGAANLNKARKQLTTSIQFFRSELMKIDPTVFGFKPEAYAVMRTNVYPTISSSRNTVFTRFLEETGVPLFEANVKQF